MSDAPAVYSAIVSVMADLSKIGVEKSMRNQQQGFAFRGIDQFYNALAPLLSKHRLLILPVVKSREMTERQTGQGKALFSVVLHIDYHLVSADDGSAHVVSCVGEAMDMADKATNKAISAGYKYMATQVFCVPTEGDTDADLSTPDVVAKVHQPLYTAEQLDEFNTAIESSDSITLLYLSRRLGIEVWTSLYNSARPGSKVAFKEKIRSMLVDGRDKVSEAIVTLKERQASDDKVGAVEILEEIPRPLLDSFAPPDLLGWIDTID